MNLNQLNPTAEKKEVMNLNLTDFSYKDERVQRETDNILFCKKHDGFTPIVFKSGPMWKGKVKRWLAVEGIGLVHTVDTQNEIAYVTIEEYLRALWGDKGFNGLPDKLKEALLQQIGITVSVTPIEPDKDAQTALNKLKAKSILYDTDLENTANLGKSEVKKKWTENLYNDMWKIGAGIGVCYALQALGILSGVA